MIKSQSPTQKDPMKLVIKKRLKLVLRHFGVVKQWCTNYVTPLFQNYLKHIFGILHALINITFMDQSARSLQNVAGLSDSSE